MSRRINVTLDAEHAAKLAVLAGRARVTEGTAASSLLSSALDAADPVPEHIGALLDGIPGAFDRVQASREHARSGRVVALDDL